SRRSCAEHTLFCTWRTGVSTLFGQLLYGAGHVDCWLLHVRGFTSALHVELIAVQSTHLAPPDPQLLFAKPALHVVPPLQQRVQFCELHGGAEHVPLEHTWLIAVQSLHAAPLTPHCLSVVIVMHVSPAQHPVQLFGPHFGGFASHLPPLQN